MFDFLTSEFVLAPLAAYIAYLLQRYLGIKLDQNARAALDSALRSAVNKAAADGHTPDVDEILDYLNRSIPDALTRLKMTGKNRPVAIERAKAAIRQYL